MWWIISLSLIQYKITKTLTGEVGDDTVSGRQTPVGFGAGGSILKKSQNLAPRNFPIVTEQESRYTKSY
jgi:hypothetical protein